MAQTQDTRTRRWTGKPWLARGIKLVAWLAPIAVSIVATHLLAQLIRRPEGAGPTVAWFIAMGIIATGVLFVVDKLARRLLPLAALFQLSLVFPDRAPSRYKAALRTRTVHQLEQRVAEIRSSGLSDDPAIAAETLIELIADLSAHDRLTRGHAERVRAYSQIIGDELNLKESEVDLLQWAGLLHDVGKLFIPDEILNKPGRLTDEEFDIIKKHPEWGAQLCEPLRGWLGDWVDAVGQHHERWDGKGYPAGIAGTDISLAARIVSVADVFDVITSIRSYKDATSAEEARKELAACAGTQFDEKVVRAFLNVSLGKLRLAMGPLSWLAQLPIIGRATLLPVAGTAASVVLTAGGLMAGNSLDAAPEYEPARVEAAAPAPTVASTVTPIATTLPPLQDEAAAASTILESTTPPSTVAQTTAPESTVPNATVPQSSVPATTTTTTTTPPTPPPTAPPTTTTPPATTPAPTIVVPSPIANDDVGTVAEGAFVDLDLGRNDQWVVSLLPLTSPANGQVTQLSPTVMRYQAMGDWFGVDSFVYEAKGTGGSTDTATVTVTVINEPDAPIAVDDEAATSEYATVNIDVLANDFDADGDVLTIAGMSSPRGLATTDGRSIDYSPTGESAGVHTISYSVSDGTGLSDTATVRVTVSAVNRPPVLSPIGPRTVDEGSTLSFSATATDPDLPANRLTFSMKGGGGPLPAGATINPGTGRFTWTPSESDGGTTYDFRIVVTDDASPPLTDEEEFTISVADVNSPPVLQAIGDRDVDELTSLSFTVSASDDDLPADTLTLSASGMPTGATFTPATGAFGWTPTAAQSPGSYDVTFTVTDNGLGTLSDAETITITVNDTNTAPVLTAIGDRSIDELSTLSFTVTATDANLPGDTLTLSSAGLPIGATFDPSTGAFNWTPTEAQGPGSYDVTFTVTDDGTGTLSDTETITITVNDTNTAPVLTAIGNRSIDELSTLSFTVTASDPDLPANTLTLSATGLPTGATFTPSTGAFGWTPTEAQGPGSYDVTFTVTDDGTGTLSDTETITITTNEANTAPTLAAIGNQAVDELAELAFTITGTDTDAPANALTYTATGLPVGATLNNSTGAFTWTPSEPQGPNFYDVTFIVTDDGPGALFASETIRITVSEVNTAPVFSDPGAQFSVIGQAINVPLVGFDPDNPANDLEFSAAGLPAGLAINPSTGAISGTPTATGSSSVTITVTETNGAPTNLADSGSFSWTITSPSILISEIATSGAGGATDEFIELYNPTNAVVPINGWKILVSDGDRGGLRTITLPGGSAIGANSYFLVARSGASVPTPDHTYSTFEMQKGAGVALVTATNTPVDAVGTGPEPWKDGSGSLYGEGTFLPPLDGNLDQSYERFSGVGNCIDTNDNSADFFHNMTSRNPQASGTVEACGTPPPFVPPPPANHVVISEFRLDGAEVLGVGGGDNEFVEIYNPTPDPINIAGYRLYSQSGGSGTLQATVPSVAPVWLQSGQHFLFASASFTIVDGIIPDVTSAGSIKNGEGVFLMDNGSTVVDAVSTGGTVTIAGTPYDEGTPLPPISGRVIHSYERLVGAAGGNCVDTDDNAADFFHNLSTQNPQNRAAGIVAGVCAT